jgi:ketosteroid isomerase-like protein
VLLGMRPTMTGCMKRALVAGEIALVNNTWEVSAAYPDGRPLRSRGLSTVVLRRRADGTWGVLIDDPWALTPS